MSLFIHGCCSTDAAAKVTKIITSSTIIAVLCLSVVHGSVFVSGSADNPFLDFGPRIVSENINVFHVLPKANAKDFDSGLCHLEQSSAVSGSVASHVFSMSLSIKTTVSSNKLDKGLIVTRKTCKRRNVSPPVDVIKVALPAASPAVSRDFFMS